MGLFLVLLCRSSPRGRLFLAELACVGERVAQPPGLTRTIASAVRLPEPVAAVWPGRLAPGVSGLGSDPLLRHARRALRLLSDDEGRDSLGKQPRWMKFTAEMPCQAFVRLGAGIGLIFSSASFIYADYQRLRYLKKEADLSNTSDVPFE